MLHQQAARTTVHVRWCGLRVHLGQGAPGCAGLLVAGAEVAGANVGGYSLLATLQQLSLPSAALKC